MGIDSELMDEWKKPIYDKERNRLITAHFRQQGMGRQQAILKITGYGSSYQKVCDHVSYIAQNFDPEKAAGVEDEQGMFYDDRDIANQVVEEWSADFRRLVPPKEQQTASLTLHLEKEAEQGTHYQKLKEYATQELSGFSWRVDKSRSKSRPNDVTLRVKGNAVELENIKECLDDYAENNHLKSAYDIKLPKARLPREVMKMIVSSPEGTDPEKVRTAARHFASEAFSDLGYRYLMALHTNTPNPHAHLVIKMRNEQGERLSTSKNDLMQWRLLWAEKAREQGIMVEASYVKSRGQGRKSEKSSLYQMRKSNAERLRKGEETREIRTDKRVKEQVQAIAKAGDYDLTTAEQRQLVTNLNEREAHIGIAQALLERARSLSGKTQQLMKKSAAILLKESIELPSPRSKMVELSKEELGATVRLPDGLKQHLSQRQATLNDRLQAPVIEQSAPLPKPPSRDKGDELEIE